MTEQSPLTYNQVHQQLADGSSASVLVKRTDGSISTGQYAETGQGELGVYLGDFANTKSNDLDQLDYKPVNVEQLSDQRQEKLAAELAGVALRGANVEVDTVIKPKPAEIVETPFSAEKANLERAVRDALAEKRRAQQEGNGENSTYWGQVAGQYQKELSKLV